MSSTVTPVALSGPRFVTTTVKTTLAPRFGVELFTDFSSSRSAAGATVIAAKSSSSCVYGGALPGCESISNSPAVATCAKLVRVPDAVTVAVICRVRLAPGVIGPPIVHTPLVAT